MGPHTSPYASHSFPNISYIVKKPIFHLHTSIWNFHICWWIILLWNIPTVRTWHSMDYFSLSQSLLKLDILSMIFYMEPTKMKMTFCLTFGSFTIHQICLITIYHIFESIVFYFYFLSIVFGLTWPNFSKITFQTNFKAMTSYLLSTSIEYNTKNGHL